MIRQRHIFPDAGAACRALADDFTALARCRVATCGRFAVALAGGTTPAAFYRLLARVYRDRIPWEAVWVFFGDERFVPPDHPDSNYRLVRETLLDHVPIPGANVHPMPTVGADPETAARRYEALLLSRFTGPPALDWVLLGVGEDGHTASLFPGFEPPPEAWVAAVFDAPKPPPRRLTLTYRTFGCAARIAFLVTGVHKAAIVSEIFTRPDRAFPAQRIWPQERLDWYLDAMAARCLSREREGVPPSQTVSEPFGCQ